MSSKRFQKAIDAARQQTPRLDAWPCRHFPECGGCAMQDVAYSDQVAVKRAALMQLWGEALPHDLEADFAVMPAPEPFGYRLRMDYVCSDDRFGLRVRKRFYAIIDLHECHLIPPPLFDKLRTVYTAARELHIPDYNVYHNTGFLRYLVVRRNSRNEWLLAFVTSEHERHEQMAQAAQAALDAGATSVWWLHNPRHADTSFGEPLGHWGAEYLPQYVLDRTLLIGPNTFFQNNIGGFEQIIRYVQPFVVGAGRMIDLYAGVGTIGMCLADYVDQVLAVEIHGPSVELARRNVHMNGLDDKIELIEADVAALEAPQHRGDVVVVDPPRAGLGPKVSATLRDHGPQRIVYISCNPLTQIADYEILKERYHLVAVRGFDLFPQTFHCEQVVVLERET
jgi:23S rRNA (uracil-5-)-methyltransferase RumA